MESVWQELQATFEAELEDRVHNLGALVLALERDESGDAGRQATLDALFREAHNLKGAARTVEQGDVEKLAHALESALREARQRRSRPVEGWFEAVYRAIDCFPKLYPETPNASDARAAELGDITTALTTGSIERTPGKIIPISPDPEPSEAAPTFAARTEIASGPKPRPDPRRNNDEQAQRSTVAPRSDHPDGPVATDSALTGVKTVRVAVEKLDSMLGLAGELSVAQLRIEARLEDLRELRQGFDEWRRSWRGTRANCISIRRKSANLDHVDPALFQQLNALLDFVDTADQRAQSLYQVAESVAAGFARETSQLALVSRDVESEVMAVRLVPVASVAGALERLVRDLARSAGKLAQLVFTGTGTEIDRKILEQLRDPLMHMLRNAVDHGVELPDARQAIGKPRSGTIHITAAQRGGFIAIEVEDDGTGIDPRRIREAAVRKGLLTDEQAAAMDDRTANDLIFRPGFSTRDTVTETSGRGVGMDVVREHVHSLNGEVAIESVLGQGSRFTLLIPITLATTRAIIVEVGQQLFGVPSATVERISRIDPRDFVRVDGSNAIPIANHPVPAVELSDILGLTRFEPAAPDAIRWRPYLVIVQAGRRVAILVDRLVGEQEVMIKSLGWPMRHVPNISGAAIVGSGQVVVVLNPAELVENSWRQLTNDRKPHPSTGSSPRKSSEAQPRRRVLVVDDSLTARTLERSILEAAGYEVVVAIDGFDALGKLRSERIDLVVSDIQMPNLDGFELTAHMRQDERLRSMPVVLVTSLEAPEHRERGVAVGADAYIAKSGFEQGQFLATIGRLV